MYNSSRKVIVGGIIPVVGTIILNYARCCTCNIHNKDIHINLVLSGGAISLEQKEFMCISCKTIDMITNSKSIDISNYDISSLDSVGFE